MLMVPMSGVRDREEVMAAVCRRSNYVESSSEKTLVIVAEGTGRLD